MGPRMIWRALRNFFWTVRQNPVWAIGALALSPVALVKHLFGVLALFLIVGLVLSLSIQLAFWYFAVPKGTLIYDGAMLAGFAATILVTLRAFVAPLVLRYG